MLTGSKGALDIATDARHVSCVLALPVFSRCAYGSGTAARAAAAIPSACIRYSLLEADPSIAFVHLSRLRQILVAATLAFWLLVDSASRTILQTLGSHLVTLEERAVAVDKMSLSNLARPLAQKLRQASTPASQQMRGFAKVPTAKGKTTSCSPGSLFRCRVTACMLAPVPAVPVAMKVLREEVGSRFQQTSMLMFKPIGVEVRPALPTAHAAVVQDLHP